MYCFCTPSFTGLFHKAIAQSGSALNSWSLGRNVAKELAEILNCPHTDEKDILAYLQSLPVEKIFEAQEKLHDVRSTFFFQKKINKLIKIISSIV